MYSEKPPYAQSPGRFTPTHYYDDKPLRTFFIDDTPWLALKDVGVLMGFSNVSEVAARLGENEKMTLTLSNSRSGRRGGTQELLLINESGLYHLSLLFTSDKPELKPRWQWLWFKALPSIRKNGGYIMRQDAIEANKLKDAAAKFAHNVMAEQDRQSEECVSNARHRTLCSTSWNLRQHTAMQYSVVIMQSPLL